MVDGWMVVSYVLGGNGCFMSRGPSVAYVKKQIVASKSAKVFLKVKMQGLCDYMIGHLKKTKNVQWTLPKI
jgi:hypothetical protein